MTTPGEGGFDVGGDEVVAKLSIDVPAGAAEDIATITRQAEQLRVELEAITRAEQGWIEYLQMVPQLTEQASAAQRSLITQLERTSYLQQQLSGLPGIAPPAGIPGQTPYSTAAPLGYVDPFTGMMAGLGRMPGQVPMGQLPDFSMGGAPGGGIQQQMQNIAENQPELAANMMAQRGVGRGVNPALLGALGAEVLEGVGRPTRGEDAGPQGKDGRESQKPADMEKGGVPESSEPTTPEEPLSQTLAWGEMGKKVTQELRTGGPRSALRTAGGLGLGMGRQYLSSHPETLKRAGLGRFVEEGEEGEDTVNFGGLGKAAGIVGLGGAGGFGLTKLWDMFQGGGEQIQQLKNFGALRGGSIGKGLQYDVESRILALSPFIDNEQARQIIQASLSEGYTGKQYDSVVKFMSDNLTEMNISVADSVSMLRSNVDKGKLSVRDLGKSLSTLKEASKTGQQGTEGMFRNYRELSRSMQSAGFEGEAMDTASREITEAWSGDRQLKDVVPKAAAGALGNSGFLMMMANANNIRALTPAEVPRRLQQQHIDYNTAFTKTLQYFVTIATQGSDGDPITGGSIFYELLTQYGFDITPDDAQALYDKLRGGFDPVAAGRKRDTEAQGEKGKFKMKDLVNSILQPGATSISKLPWSSMATTVHDVAEDPLGSISNFFTKTIPGWFGHRKSDDGDANTDPEIQGPSNPNYYNQPARTTSAVRTEGTVTGQLTVRIDQDGRARAPDTIRLTGNQISANAGYGANQLNNPGPGDIHGHNGWGSSASI